MNIIKKEILMEHKKIIAVALGVLATVILFSVVYSQFATKGAMAPQQQKVAGKGGAMIQPATPVADPETVEDISMAIDAQLAEDSAALDAEIAAEIADIEGEITSLNELNETYDENAY